MTRLKSSPSQLLSPVHPSTPTLACTLLWRQGKIWVGLADSTTDFVLPALADDAWFRTCLTKSKARAVCIDSELGQEAIQAWAKACHEANKPTYLRVPSTSALPHKQRFLAWWAKRLCDFVAALLLLILFSPVMLLLAGLIYLQDGGPIFYTQWRVGRRGKLFRIFKFRSMGVDAEQLHHRVMGNQSGLHKLKHDPRVTPLGRYMRKYSLDELPQLFNVLLGQMSMVGPRPWALYDALQIAPELRHRLNALPGITGAWQVTARSNDCDLTSVNRMDLDYLRGWTFQNDFKFLLMTVPKVIAGFGAY